MLLLLAALAILAAVVLLPLIAPALLALAG
jgi:hypothetical protein